MEWGLNKEELQKKLVEVGLNPCSNGMGIEQPSTMRRSSSGCRLNPCSNGMGIEQLF